MEDETKYRIVMYEVKDEGKLDGWYIEFGLEQQCKLGPHFTAKDAFNAAWEYLHPKRT